MRAMRIIKNACFGVMTAAVLFSAVPVCQASARIEVPETVFQWVQSTSRQNYYFNKEQMCYGVKPNGDIDIGTLIVPTLRTFDDVQKQDVIDKRRWKMESVKGYDDLVGSADYLAIDLRSRTVKVTKHDDLDSTWSALSSNTDGPTIDMNKMSGKDVESKFCNAILQYAAKHQDELLARTKGKLSAADAKILKTKKDPLFQPAVNPLQNDTVTKTAAKK
ncbi:hypothetical protein [Mitsuokella sp. WILCCON 0060]|uniref:hypothetical protein n=1 Tax=unclassified Mitsuokella TaxID=2637239 RepID=UPI003F1228CE